jgi:c-di-GMP phosphodiesterase
MRAQPLPVPSDPAEPTTADVFVSRQPVVDGAMRVVGYRVSYAMLDHEDVVTDGDRSATGLFVDVLSSVAIEELVGDNLAHLPVSRELLLKLGIPPVRPDRVMLRIDYETAVDPELVDIVPAMAGRGYALVLHDLPSPDFDPALLDSFGTVEVDLSAWDDAQVATAIVKIQAGRATPLAIGLRDHRDFERAKLFGFELFAGRFFASGRMTQVRKVPVGSLDTLISLARLQGEAAEIEELETVINRDVGLSVRLLRYINSAYFGMRSDITSIRQAVMMLGARALSRWALLVALTGGPSTPRELSVMALTRARMCELLGAGRNDVGEDQLFTIGLLSTAEALLDLPLETIVRELALADQITAALLRHEGPAGSILDAVLAYEAGTFDIESMRPHLFSIAKAYRDALRWAQSTISEVS